MFFVCYGVSYSLWLLCHGPRETWLCRGGARSMFIALYNLLFLFAPACSKELHEQYQRYRTFHRQLELAFVPKIHMGHHMVSRRPQVCACPLLSIGSASLAKQPSLEQQASQPTSQAKHPAVTLWTCPISSRSLPQVERRPRSNAQLSFGFKSGPMPSWKKASIQCQVERRPRSKWLAIFKNVIC